MASSTGEAGWRTTIQNRVFHPTRTRGDSAREAVEMNIAEAIFCYNVGLVCESILSTTVKGRSVDREVYMMTQ